MEWFLLCTRPGDSVMFISCQIASSSRSFKVGEDFPPVW